MIPIFFAVDEKYVAPLCAAIQSLITNADPAKTYHLTILNQGLADDSVQSLADLTTSNVAIDFVSMADKLRAQVNDHGNTLRADYFTLTIYYRLFIADMFPELDKALYLDADVICEADVATLFATDVRHALVAAAPDPFIAGDPITAAYAERVVGVPAEQYVNSGVLVMNLKAMRAQHFSAHFLTLLNQYHFASIAPDQDYINAIAHDQLVLLASQWNVQAPGEPAPKLIHYNLFNKPWHYQTVDYGEHFWRYAQTTAVRERLAAMQQAFGPAGAAHDQDRMQKLVAKAQQTTETAAVTFAAVQADTGTVRL
ncbi:glycosyltransferase family 8 protein [Lacticaseibacillus daqingensis]|uniref:glycosyltransferase family 8 protein n=1 Tax=Lacticaseibacillus daqingensis TaxID=2486014 RepID=UPI000F79654F|nr:glycosyltransferase family 8 protein [Lacticaseibacillus daqingensis]